MEQKKRERERELWVFHSRWRSVEGARKIGQERSKSEWRWWTYMMNVNAGVCKEHRRLVEERHCERQESRTAWLRQAIKIVFWRETHVCRLYFPFLWPNAALSGQLHLHCDAHGVPVSQLSHVFSFLLSRLSRRPCFSLVSPFRLSSFLFPR